MSNTASFQPGMIIEVTAHPEWGPGKIVHRRFNTLHVIFRDKEDQYAMPLSATSDLLRSAPSQSDRILDNLPPLIEKPEGWTFKTKRLTVESLKKKFLDIFPAGFADEEYLRQERDYKLAAHLRFKKLLDVSGIRHLLQVGHMRELAEKGLAVVGPLNLLAMFEQAAFHDAMQHDDAVRSFFSSLLKVLDTDPITEAVFSQYAKAVCELPAERGPVAKWTVATAFPYVAQPDRFMFLKPEVTKEAASSMVWDLKYKSEPNWMTYKALLDLGITYLDLLRPLGARDFMDVQSFIWVSCGGYDAAVAKKQAKQMSGAETK